MRTSGRMLVAVLALGASGSALAVSVGEKLYVRAKNTRVMQSPSPTADVLTLLQPPQQVVWQGAHPKQKQWHQVKVGNYLGYVFQSNLSTKPPSMELTSSKGAGKVDARAFASSGAAVKALSSGVIQMGQRRMDLKEAVTQLQALEDLAKEVKDTDLAAHAEQAGLHPVVGSAQAKEAAR